MRYTQALALLVIICSCATARSAEKQQLWLYYPVNLLVDANLDKAKTIWSRAASAGYDHVLIADSKFSRLDKMDPHYFQNCRKAQQIAADLKLQLVPAVFPIGYSNDILSEDPNLAEGLPVRDQPFVVTDGEIRVSPDPSIHFGKPSFHDPSVALDGNVATVAGGKGSARLTFQLNVPKFRCFHISVKLKTDSLESRPEIKALAGEQSLQWQNIAFKPTQDWTQVDVVFNSLDHDKVNIYFGIWDDIRGQMQWKDWSIEETGLVNVLRRPGAPCVVKDANTGKTLAEGTDYDAIVDPKMGNVPYAGEYESFHAVAPTKTHLPNGTKLLISWYHPAIVYDGQVSGCVSEPKMTALLADQARRMKELWNAPLYMMSYDEFRTLNYDEACEKQKQTPGELLAASARDCTKLLQPAAAAIWNDMFDPYHNAVKGPYYLVNGPYTNSWEGLSKDVLIVNWNHGKRDQSLKFFADRGNPQLIAGYYDNDLSQVTEWKTSVAKVSGVVGYMYTTWQGDYSKVEKFAEMVK